MDRTIIRRIIELKQGRLNKQESQMLQDWAVQSQENQAFVDSLNLIWDNSEDFKPNVTFDSQEAFERFQSKINSKENKAAVKGHYKILYRIAAGLLFLVMATGIYHLYTSSSSNQQLVESTLDQIKSIDLIDGSNIQLNVESKLTYFAGLEEKSRKVSLVGEGFFDVSRNENKPFIIHTENFKIEVLGTSFNVRDYKSDGIAEVFVKSGKVKVIAKKSNQVLVLTADEHLYINKETQAFKKSKTAKRNAIAWINGKLSFKKSALSDVLNDVENYFNVSIVLENEALKTCPYTSLFNEPDLDSIIETISAVFDMQIKQEGSQNFTLSGGTCN